MITLHFPKGTLLSQYKAMDSHSEGYCSIPGKICVRIFCSQTETVLSAKDKNWESEYYNHSLSPRGLGLSPGQSMWNLWHWDHRFFSGSSVFPSQYYSSIAPYSNSHLPMTWAIALTKQHIVIHSVLS
jgi:hypothetical protein